MGIGSDYFAAPSSRISGGKAFKVRLQLATLGIAAALVSPTSALAHDPTPAVGWPSHHGFQPHHPYRDGMILQPGPEGPFPVHVRIYSTPHEPPYYNVPPYIVLDP